MTGPLKALAGCLLAWVSSASTVDAEAGFDLDALPMNVTVGEAARWLLRGSCYQYVDDADISGHPVDRAVISSAPKWVTLDSALLLIAPPDALLVIDNDSRPPRVTHRYPQSVREWAVVDISPRNEWALPDTTRDSVITDAHGPSSVVAPAAPAIDEAEALDERLAKVERQLTDAPHQADEWGVVTEKLSALDSKLEALERTIGTEHGSDEAALNQRVELIAAKLDALETRPAQPRAPDVDALEGEKENALGVAAYRAQDYVAAIDHFRRAAELGNLDAMNNLGHVHQFGLGTIEDVDAARTWFSKASERGHRVAEENLRQTLEDRGAR